jgi:hypothetical protein
VSQYRKLIRSGYRIPVAHALAICESGSDNFNGPLRFVTPHHRMAIRHLQELRGRSRWSRGEQPRRFADLIRELERNFPVMRAV